MQCPRTQAPQQQLGLMGYPLWPLLTEYLPLQEIEFVRIKPDLHPQHTGFLNAEIRPCKVIVQSYQHVSYIF